MEEMRLNRRTKEELEKSQELSDQIAKDYAQYINLTLVNRSSDVTFKRLLSTLNDLRSQPQFLPSAWN